MFELNPEKERKTLDREIAENMPPVEGPYPDYIVRNRELLLIAQCLLAEYSWTDKKEQKMILAEIYGRTMHFYFENLQSYS